MSMSRSNDAYVCMLRACNAQWTPEEVTESPGTGDTDSWELPGGCWEQAPPEDKLMLMIAELSLQPYQKHF